jgi:hypothetical protein
MSEPKITIDASSWNRVVRERDEAREGLAEEIKFHHRTHSELVQTQCQMQDVIRERDKARELAQQMSDSNQVLLADVRFYRNAWEQLKEGWQ